MMWSSSASIPFLIGIALFLFSLFMLYRSKLFPSLLRAAPALLLLCCAVLLILASMDVMSYRQLLKEKWVATLHFEQLAPQSYSAKLIHQDNQQHSFFLKGDQWQIDARLIRWHPDLAALGFQPLYRLERIGGRYIEINQELNSPRTLYPIESASFLDIWSWFKEIEWLHRWVDASYGSATFLPMTNGAVYEISVGYSGLVARPINEKGRQAVMNWQ